MVNIKKILFFAFIIGGVAAALFYFIKSPEDMIKAQLKKLSSAMEKTGDENNLAALGKIKTVGDLFTDPCFIEVEVDAYPMAQTQDFSVSGTYEPRAVSRRAAAVRQRFSNFSVGFQDITIKITGEDSARVLATASVRGRAPGYEDFNAFHEVSLVFQKIDDQWLIHRVGVVNVLEK